MYIVILYINIENVLTISHFKFQELYMFGYVMISYRLLNLYRISNTGCFDRSSVPGIHHKCVCVYVGLTIASFHSKQCIFLTIICKL